MTHHRQKIRFGAIGIFSGFLGVSQRGGLNSHLVVTLLQARGHLIKGCRHLADFVIGSQTDAMAQIASADLADSGLKALHRPQKTPFKQS